MNVHVVTNANRPFYRDQIDAMYRLRHRLFVEEMGWKDLASADGREIDQFDDANAVYLIVCEGEEVMGSIRLLPTWRRCMITEIFPEFLDKPCPRGPDIWEWTRYCPGVTASPRDLFTVRAMLLTATLEFGLSRGVSTYLAFGETKFLGQLEELGWSPQPLCLPRPYPEGTAITMAWDVRAEMLSETREMFGLNVPVLVEAPAFTGDLIASISPQHLNDMWPAGTVRARHANRRQNRPNPVAAQPDLVTAEPRGRA